MTSTDLIFKRFDDMGVRLDRQEARIDRLENKIDKQDAKIDALDAKIDALGAKIDARFEKQDERLSHLEKDFAELQATTRENSFLLREMNNRQEYQMAAIRDFVYWAFSLIALLIVIAPAVRKFLQKITSPKFTLDDVKNLIREETQKRGEKIS